MKRDFTVAVCDTQKTELASVEAIIKEWLEDAGNAQPRLELFSDIRTAREKLAGGFGADIYVIGVPPHGASSVELAHIIRRLQPDVPIIINAATRAYAFEAYEIRVLRYLLRPAERTELLSALDFALLVHRALPADTITVRMPGESRTLNTADVVYVENNVRSMRYILRDGSTLTGTRRNISFEEFFSPLLQSGRFVQPHKSFIINIRYIRSVKSSSVVMTNGIQVPISRRHVAEVQEAYRRFGG
ncbi:MAG: LytTR family transcriptional regulator DNA-binding domain-containing protein [Ruminiclostridium sp.]|nr:LytTR family transcriptional regulator DNA-binding domain-containing protein [Ruminiclostridium sp.]